MTNRLAASTSPYLLQHADNPVDWREWSEEALAEAKRRDVTFRSFCRSATELVTVPRHGRDRLRLEVASVNDLAAETERLIALGATPVALDRDGAAVLADPDGNEFTVLPRLG